MGHYFIAYSRRDFYFAESLFYALHSHRIDAWMDVWKITPGTNWDDAITNAIESCEGLILIATKDSLQSPYVRDEICRAYQHEKPIYLIIRSRLSERDLLISHEYPKGKDNRIDLRTHVRAIVDMRAKFARGIERVAAAIAQNADIRDALPGAFSLKMERILYIPPIIIFLVLLMVGTALWKYGIEALFFSQDPFQDPLSQLMAYIRDTAHGRPGVLLLLVPTLIGSIISVGALANIIVFGFNFSRRKRVAASHFALLLVSLAVTVAITLFSDVTAAFFYFVALVIDKGFVTLNRALYTLVVDKNLIALWVLHAIIFILVAILGIVFIAKSLGGDGQGAILRWLPTGRASSNIRRRGNEAWIRGLADITVSPSPSYPSYYIVASPEDRSAAENIRTLFQEKGYVITDNRMDAECDLIILSPFADDTPLRSQYRELNPKPAIYVLSRSMKPQKNMSIALQWIDYRRPMPEQFWKQWEKRFSNLKGSHTVFPYVPESLGESLLPITCGCGLRMMMFAVAAGAALEAAGVAYITLVRNVGDRLLLLASVVLVLGAVGLSYYTVAQMLRAVISPASAWRRLAIAGILTIIAACVSQSVWLAIGSIGIVVVNVFVAGMARSGLRDWLPPKSKKPRKKSLLQPISKYKAFTSPLYGAIMILWFLAGNAFVINHWVVPGISRQSSSTPYAVTVPGPYYLAESGLWSQDAYASAFGYHFDYHPDSLEVSQDHVTGMPTWLMFSGIDSYPMQFAPHFTSSIHVHFTNDALQTDFGLVLNNFLGDHIGPQLRLSASGVWTVIESTSNHFSGLIAKRELSHDYTIEVEVNGILCIFKINGKEIATIADTSTANIYDILLSFSNLAPKGARYFLSNFTYTPEPGPVLDRDEAMRRVRALNTAPYTTVAPGWNCNPDDGRWSAGYEPVQQSSALRCTSAGTQVTSSAQNPILLYFDNSRYGELPHYFDYSFHATFHGNSDQCVSVATFANVGIGFVYTYAFTLCSDGQWQLKYGGYRTDDGSTFPNEQLRSGRIDIKSAIAVMVEFRSTTLNFFIDDELITSYQASGLMPSIVFGNDKGMVLYSDFSYVPRTQP